eukprot:scaffold226591_cov36-Tisochrysis_lutea.AAC.4
MPNEVYMPDGKKAKAHDVRTPHTGATARLRTRRMNPNAEKMNRSRTNTRHQLCYLSLEDSVFTESTSHHLGMW